MEILDGKLVRDKILEDLKEKISNVNDRIKLAIIYVGTNDASDLYIKNKQKYCEMVGIEADLYRLDSDCNEENIIDLISELNNNDSVHGIILQSPIPSHLNFDYCSNFIVPEKDVDGFTTENVYANYIGSGGYLPCTVKGIIKLLDYYNIDVEGKEIVIVGRGMIVGKPLSIALSNLNATVTSAHSKTRNLSEVCKRADILISATGVSKLISSEYVKDGAVVIDVGISKLDGKLCGDVNFDSVSEKCSYITPVPGGVGPMTIAMLLENTYEAYRRSKENG